MYAGEYSNNIRHGKGFNYHKGLCSVPSVCCALAEPPGVCCCVCAPCLCVARIVLFPECCKAAKEPWRSGGVGHDWRRRPIKRLHG